MSISGGIRNAPRLRGVSAFLAVVVVVVLGLTTNASAAGLTWSGPLTVDRSGATPLDAVACPASTQCTAVDPSGQEVTFDPTGPGHPTAATIDLVGAGLRSVSCPTAAQCTAVDGEGHEVTFDPRTGSVNAAGVRTVFTVSGPFVPPELDSVSCPTAGQCTATDGNGHEVTFDPATGAVNGAGIQSDPTFGVVSCTTTTQCTSVAGGNELTFDPTTGSPNAAGTRTVDSGGFLVSVSCLPGGACTAADNGGHEVTFAPGTGAVNSAGVKLVDSAAHAPVSVACSSSTRCTLLDRPGAEVTFDPNTGTVNGAGRVAVGGGAIDAPVNPQQGPLVACPVAGQCTAVDINGAEVTFDPATGALNGAGLTKVDGGAALRGVACPSGTQCTGVDALGNEVTFDPIARSVHAPVRVDLPATCGPTPGCVPLNGIACPSVTQCTAVDESGSEVTFDPQTGTPNAVGTMVVSTRRLRAVSCPSTTQCTAVSDPFGGSPSPAPEYTFNPVSGAAITSGPATDQIAASDVACPSSSQCTLTGTPIAGGVEVTLNPTTSTPNAAGTQSVGGDALACPTLAQCTAVTGQRATTFNPGSGAATAGPTPIESGTADLLDDVACPSSSLCIAVDRPTVNATGTAAQSAALSFDPSTAAGTTRQPIAGAAALNAVSCSSTTLCVTVDAVGNAFVGTAPAASVTARTLGVIHVGRETARVFGLIETRGRAVRWHFKVGAVLGHGHFRTAERTTATGRGAVLVSVRVTGLRPGTMYHYRLFAAAVGAPREVARGGLRFFTTAREPVRRHPRRHR